MKACEGAINFNLRIHFKHDAAFPGPLNRDVSKF